MVREDPLERLRSAHVATPYRSTGGSPGGKTQSGISIPGPVIDCLTWCNFLWTSRVQVLSAASELPVLLSYGAPVSGLRYATVERGADDGQSVTLVGTLGEGTGTRLELEPDSSLLKLSYLRYGATCQLLLAPPGDARAQAEARRKSQYGCVALSSFACCAECVCPCFRSTCGRCFTACAYSVAAGNSKVHSKVEGSASG